MTVLQIVPFVPGIIGPIPNCYLFVFHSEMIFIAEPSKKAAPYFHLPETQHTLLSRHLRRLFNAGRQKL
jgi:hypothetical protein